MCEEKRYQDIADELGVSRSAIGHVMVGNTWSHIPSTEERVTA